MASWQDDPIAQPQQRQAAPWESDPIANVSVDVKPFAERALSNVAKPFTSYPSAQRQMASEGRNAFSEGINQIKQAYQSAPGIGAPNFEAGGQAVGGAVKALGGAAGYLGSPINAALHTFLGKPIEENTGVPAAYPELAASLALPIPKNIPLGAISRAATGAEKAVPSTSELFAAGRAGREAARTSDFVAPAQDVAALRQQFATVSKQEGHGTLAPKVSQIMDEGLPASGPMTAPELVTLRQQLANAGKNGGTEAGAAKDAKKIVDSYLGQNIPDANAANANFTTAFKSKALDRVVDNASRANNPEAALISGIRSIRNGKNAQRDFSADELAKMDDIINSGLPKALKSGGRFIGGAGDLRAWIAGALASPAAPVFGYALRKIGSAITNNEVAKLSEMVRSNAPAAKAVSASLKDWSIATHAFEVDPSVRAFARLTLASRNLSNNLKVGGIAVPPDKLLRAVHGAVKGRSNPEQPEPERVINDHPNGNQP